MATQEKEQIVQPCREDFWSEWTRFPKCDWQYEVQNGATLLGYWEWVSHKTGEANAVRTRSIPMN